jgi:hypothetical protein
MYGHRRHNRLLSPLQIHKYVYVIRFLPWNRGIGILLRLFVRDTQHKWIESYSVEYSEADSKPRFTCCWFVDHWWSVDLFWHFNSTPKCFLLYFSLEILVPVINLPESSSILWIWWPQCLPWIFAAQPLNAINVAYRIPCIYHILFTLYLLLLFFPATKGPGMGRERYGVRDNEWPHYALGSLESHVLFPRWSAVIESFVWWSGTMTNCELDGGSYCGEE